MAKARISFKTGYGLCEEAIVQPWDQAAFDIVERRFLRLLPKRRLDQVHTDDLYFAGRFYFMAALHSEQQRYYLRSKTFFDAASQNVGNFAKGTILDVQSWMLIESGDRRAKLRARATLWQIIKRASISESHDAAVTIAITSKSERMKAKAAAAALARYEAICKELRRDVQRYSELAAYEQRTRASRKKKRANQSRRR